MAPGLLYTRGGGRLGNQLLNYANLLAFNLEHPRFEVVDLAFVPYREEYGGKMALADVGSASLNGPWRGVVRTLWGPLERGFGSPRVVERVRTHLLHRLADLRGDAQSLVAGDAFWRFDVVGDHYERLDLSRTEIVDRLESRAISVVAGWDVRCWPLVARHAGEIRERMRPADRYYRVGEPYVEDLHDEFDHVAGVHVRQDDYREWRNKMYFFESSQYRAFMKAYAATRPEDRVGFLITSDEAQPSDLFDEHRFRFGTATADDTGSTHYLEDFVELSLCDAVLATPSSFSGVAAFVGDVPLVPLYDGVLNEGLTTTTSDLATCVDHPVMSDAIN